MLSASPRSLQANVPSPAHAMDHTRGAARPPSVAARVPEHPWIYGPELESVDSSSRGFSSGVVSLVSAPVDVALVTGSSAVAVGEAVRVGGMLRAVRDEVMAEAVIGADLRGDSMSAEDRHLWYSLQDSTTTGKQILVSLSCSLCVFSLSFSRVSNGMLRCPSVSNLEPLCQPGASQFLRRFHV